MIINSDIHDDDDKNYYIRLTYVINLNLSLIKYLIILLKKFIYIAKHIHRYKDQSNQEKCNYSV